MLVISGNNHYILFFQSAACINKVIDYPSIHFLQFFSRINAIKNPLIVFIPYQTFYAFCLTTTAT